MSPLKRPNNGVFPEKEAVASIPGPNLHMCQYFEKAYSKKAQQGDCDVELMPYIH